MNDYITQARRKYDDPQKQWEWALAQRRKNPDQALANAEHYLWNSHYASKGPLEAVGGLITPFGYYAGKKLGLLGGRSEPSLEQLKYGLFGAIDGITR